jgi:hypothetical protein
MALKRTYAEPAVCTAVGQWCRLRCAHVYCCTSTQHTTVLGGDGTGANVVRGAVPLRHILARRW